MDSHTRSIIKAISYRCLGSASTFLIILLVTGDLKVSMGAGILDTFAKIGLYFLHERLWERIPFGRERPPEYEI